MTLEEEYSMFDLKHFFISNNLAYDNEYLDRYVKLVADNNATQFEKIYFEKHHVIPVFCYKYLYNCEDRIAAKKIADGDENNYLVNLSVYDHLMAHYLLQKCLKQIQLKYWNWSAITFTRYSDIGKQEISEDWILSNLTDLALLRVEAKKLNSLFHAGANHPNYGKHLSVETREKMSKAKKGIYGSNGKVGTKLSDETKLKLSLNHSGEHCYLYGKHHSDETKQKMSASHKGKKPNWSTDGRARTLATSQKSVICIETDTIYKSIAEAARQTGVSSDCISNVCRGVTKTAGGYHWSYYELKETD